MFYIIQCKSKTNTHDNIHFYYYFYYHYYTFLYHAREKTVKYPRIIQSFPDAHGPIAS